MLRRLPVARLAIAGIGVIPRRIVAGVAALLLLGRLAIARLPVSGVGISRLLSISHGWLLLAVTGRRISGLLLRRAAISRRGRVLPIAGLAVAALVRVIGWIGRLLVRITGIGRRRSARLLARLIPRRLGRLLLRLPRRWVSRRFRWTWLHAG